MKYQIIKMRCMIISELRGKQHLVCKLCSVQNYCPKCILCGKLWDIFMNYAGSCGNFSRIPSECGKMELKKVAISQPPQINSVFASQ